MPHFPSIYAFTMLAGICLSALLWRRMARRDPRMIAIYVSGLCGAFLGAKIVYILAEGWLHFGEKEMWLHLATGKTIIGALLGGYGGVELCKSTLGYRETTGDTFALVAPVGIMLGRIGCLAQGCCPGAVCTPAWYAMTDASGISCWPAVPVEIAFNLLFLLLVFVILKPRAILPGQHFHLYLIGYGVFRTIHEAFRDTPRILGPITGYQIASLAVLILGVARFTQRRRAPSPTLSTRM